MPELPEVEFACRRLRLATVGRVVARVEPLHGSLARQLPAAVRRALEGCSVERVERRAKVQLVHLSDGAILEVHFRMTGDWDIGAVGDAPPRHERLQLVTTDGVRVSLVDSRALSVVKRHDPGTYVEPPTGPEPLTDDFSTEIFLGALRRRTGPIKPALLDQKVVAGVGNIYAAEALWEARIAPTAVANRLSPARVAALRDAIRLVLERAPKERHYGSALPADAPNWRVYERDGAPCLRCGTAISRIVQAGRSTCYCRRCQRR